jgi:hypothetical protein
MVVGHRMRQTTLILKVEVRPIPEFAHRMRGEEFRRRPFGRRLPGDSFGAVLAKLERGGMFGIGPGAAWAIEPVRLVHAEQTTSLSYDGYLAAYRICHGFQSAPPSRCAFVLVDAYDIVFAHCALHGRG